MLTHSVQWRYVTADLESNLRTESLYFRASPKVRDEANRYATDNSLRLSSALAALVERGLEAVKDEPSVRALEERTQRLTSTVAQLNQQVAVLIERDQKWNAFFSSLRGQLQTIPVGKCPACHQNVTAADQVLTFRCPWPTCSKPLRTVERTEEIPPAFAGLVGALGGLLLGLAASQSSVKT